MSDDTKRSERDARLEAAAVRVRAAYLAAQPAVIRAEARGSRAVERIQRLQRLRRAEAALIAVARRRER